MPREVEPQCRRWSAQLCHGSGGTHVQGAAGDALDPVTGSPSMPFRHATYTCRVQVSLGSSCGKASELAFAMPLLDKVKRGPFLVARRLFHLLYVSYYEEVKI